MVNKRIDERPVSSVFSNSNLNTLNLIDRINLYYKSSKSADITFDDANWVLDEIDNLKTLDDVKVLC